MLKRQQDLERRALQAEGAAGTEAAQTGKDGVWQGTGLSSAEAAGELSGGGVGMALRIREDWP